MSFTLWKQGVMIGETDFALGGRRGRQRIGAFHPTPSGMLALPAITAMAPALLECGAVLKQLPLSDEELERDGDAALALFERTPEGRRVLAAAEQIAQLELRDPSGKPVTFESFLLSDLEELATPGASSRDAMVARRKHPSAPIRYVISVSLRDPGLWSKAESALEA